MVPTECAAEPSTGVKIAPGEGPDSKSLGDALESLDQAGEDFADAGAR